MPDAGSDAQPPLEPLAPWVDPFIGTSGDGFASPNCYPGAVAPFGMVQVSPDTTAPSGAAAYSHAAGYHHADTLILGFSHTRLQGVSTPDLGSVLLLPGSGDLSALTTAEGRRAAKSVEEARAGYYAVTLARHRVRAELTASERCAYHRYTWDEGVDTGHVVVDLGHALVDTEVLEAELVAGPTSARGMTRPSGRFSSKVGGMPTYFVLRFDRDPSYLNVFENGALKNSLSAEGPQAGAIYSFELSEQRSLTARVCISFVDAAGAQANLEAEPADATFASIREATTAQWEEQLRKVSFRGGTDAQRRIMATALYHSFLMPNLFQDADGRYRGMDGQAHQADFRYYANFSMWDTYRTVHPLLSLVDSSRERDMVQSLVAMGEDGGFLPRWQMGYAYTNGTIGDPADIVIADSYLRGVTDFDAPRALELMLESASDPTPAEHPYGGRSAVEHYAAHGWVPSDEESRSVSETQELAISDFAISALARELGDEETASTFATRGTSYEKLWNEDQQLFRGRRRDGGWHEPFDPLGYESGDLFYGGNAQQYLWLVPHDMSGLQRLFGGPSELQGALDAFFEASQLEQENDSLAGILPPKYYAHGNEPDIHAPYLYVQAGRPDQVQRWVAWASELFYSDQPDGIVGNEDSGALSAWYVLSAIGLYPVPATDLYLIGRPLFEHVELARGEGVFTIEVENASRTYVQSATLDGEPLGRAWLRHSELGPGGVLSFVMGDHASDWARGSPPP